MVRRTVWILLGGRLMVKEDVYKELAEMINREDPHVVGVPVTPAFLKVLRLQFTPEEAKLALQIGLTGGNIG